MDSALPSSSSFTLTVRPQTLQTYPAFSDIVDRKSRKVVFLSVNLRLTLDDLKADACVESFKSVINLLRIDLVTIRLEMIRMYVVRLKIKKLEVVKGNQYVNNKMINMSKR